MQTNKNAYISELFKTKTVFMNNNHYCVILAGGIGTRLWPSSRQRLPKQFLDLLGTGETLLQATYRRYASIINPENIIVLVNEQHRDIARKQLPQLPEHNLLLEPIRRNTVPSVTWAAINIGQRNRNALMLVSPSDQLITNEAALQADVEKAFAYIEASQRLLALGITPSRPDTTYGYIQMADTTDDGIHKVKSFSEKPEADFAKIFMESHEFLWNTGIFAWSAKTFLSTVMQISSEFQDVMREVEVMLREGQHSPTLINDAFAICPNISLETGVLEKVDNVDVMLCHFGWTDLGTWDKLYDVMPKQDGNNVTIGAKAMYYDTTDCIVKLPEGKLAVLQGLHDYNVIDDGNILLVCRRNDQSTIRMIVNDVQMNMGEEYL